MEARSNPFGEIAKPGSEAVIPSGVTARGFPPSMLCEYKRRE